MNTPALILAGAAVLSALAVSDETEGHALTVGGPEMKPPRGLSLDITEGTMLRAPSEEWFEARAEEEPERFVYVDELVDADGEMVGGYRDNEGEYELIYDLEEDEYVYWQHVSAEVLTRGRRDFVQYCASCHGFDGDGYGRSGMALRPPPRNFTSPSFKFSKVPGEYLPTDDALVRLVKRGLNGTAMLPWALSEEQLGEIMQYVKSLSPEGLGWRDVYAEIEGPIRAGDDPWAGRIDDAVARGELVYHGVAKCNSCHPGYVTVPRLAEINEIPVADFQPRPDYTYPVAKATDIYQVKGHPVAFLPPDFTWQEVRSGITPADLFETIGAGIGGTAMPRWKGSLPDEDIWAMAHYVRHLIDEYKGKPAKRAAFFNGLRN